MDELNVHISNPLNNQSGNSGRAPEKIKKFLFTPKIIFVILGIIVLAEVIYTVKTLSGASSSPPPLGKSDNQIITGGKISLTTPKTSMKVNEVVPVSVMIDAGKHTLNGVDLIVRVDPKAVEVLPSGLVKGTIFSDYPLVASDPNTGLITISGVSNAGSNFTGKGLFATLNLKAKLPGRTSLAIDFQKGTTTASNLVEASSSENILEQVDNLELQIQ